MGRIAEAETLIEESDGLASRADVATAIGVARARAFVAAAGVSREEAIARAEEAVRVADVTDYLDERADFYLHLGEMLDRSGARRRRRAVPLREAIALADRKGSTVLADRARTLLADAIAPQAG